MRVLVVSHGESSITFDPELRGGIFPTRLARIAHQIGHEVSHLAAWTASGSSWLTALRNWRHLLGRHAWSVDGVKHYYRGILGPPRYFEANLTAGRLLMRAHLHEWLDTYGRPDIAHVHWGLMGQSQQAIEILADLGVPTILTEHSSAFFTSTNARQFERYSRVVSRAKVLTAVSRTLAAQITSRTGLKNIEVLPNAIDPIFRGTVEPTSFSELRILVVGTSRIKRPELALEGIRLLSENGVPTHVRLIGAEAKDLVRGFRQTDRFTVLPMQLLSPAELRARYQEVDVLVCMSDYETFGCAPIEAAMSGCGVVSTRVGVVPDLIASGCGLAVDQSPEALARALALFFADLWGWRRRRKEVSRIADTMFGTETVQESLRTIYDSAVR
jgi:glycosyltransferase involved in cell wall biosynthesis